MSIITDATLEKVRQQIILRNNRLRDFAELYAQTTWDNVRLDVRTMSAEALAEKYPIGTQLICGYTLDGTRYDFPWVVLDNNRECEWEDGSTHPGLWLGARYGTIEDIQFDAAESTDVDLTEEPNALEGWYYWGVTGSTYTALNLATGDAIPTTYDSVKKCGINHVDVLRYGYNRWSHSGQRQWLNSAANAGEWWTAQHLGDIAPSQLASRKGFMAGLDSDFLNVVHAVKVHTSCNTVTDGGVTDTTVDKFFLQSLEEVYGVPQASGVEGDYFPYWKQILGLDEPSNAANDARKISRINTPTGSAVYLRLRSANRGYSYIAWYIHSGGGLNYGYYASSSYSALPACVIS